MSLLFEQTLAFASIVLVFKLLEARSFMRGLERKPLSDSTNRLLRTVYLLLMFAPILYRIPFWGFSILIIYWWSFIDLTKIRGGRANLWMRRLGIISFLKRRLGVKLIKTVDFDTSKTYIFCIHPHGILPFGSLIAMCYEFEGNFSSQFPGIDFRFLAASFCFYFPILRDLCLGAGIVDAARFSATRVLEKGLSLCLYPGGATEALYSDPQIDVLVLRKRLGFIKLALENGTPLVPIFAFNETEYCILAKSENQIVALIQRNFQRMFGLSLPLLRNLIPLQTCVTTVVGAPIVVPKIEDPSHEQIEKYLEIYIEALTELHSKNKDLYSLRLGKKLKII